MRVPVCWEDRQSGIERGVVVVGRTTCRSSEPLKDARMLRRESSAVNLQVLASVGGVGGGGVGVGRKGQRAASTVAASRRLFGVARVLRREPFAVNLQVHDALARTLDRSAVPRRGSRRCCSSCRESSTVNLQVLVALARPFDRLTVPRRRRRTLSSRPGFDRIDAAVVRRRRRRKQAAATEAKDLKMT